MTFICATNIKHISTDQIKTTFRFSSNETWCNAPKTSIKERYVMSSGAMLKQRHVNKQKDDFSSVLQQNVSTKRRFHKICLRKNRCGCWQNKQYGWLQTLSLTLFARSFRRRFFTHHHVVKHPHTIIILSWVSIPLVLKCVAKMLTIG